MSKAFISLLRNHFSEDTRIKELVANSPIEYPEILREEGVSFNPLPARLVDISVKFGLSEDEIVSLLLAAKESSLTYFEPIKKLLPKLSAVWAIDALRHFKMSGLDKEYARNIFTLTTYDHPMVTKAKEQYEKILL